MSFDRKGKCPVCKKPFQECQHSWDYAHSVLKAAKAYPSFVRDVARVGKKKK